MCCKSTSVVWYFHIYIYIYIYTTYIHLFFHIWVFLTSEPFFIKLHCITFSHYHSVIRTVSFFKKCYFPLHIKNPALVKQKLNCECKREPISLESSSSWLVESKKLWLLWGSLVFFLPEGHCRRWSHKHGWESGTGLSEKGCVNLSVKTHDFTTPVSTSAS